MLTESNVSKHNTCKIDKLCFLAYSDKVGFCFVFIFTRERDLINNYLDHTVLWTSIREIVLIDN